MLGYCVIPILLWYLCFLFIVKIYYYIDSHGEKHGSINEHKVRIIAEQNYAIHTLNSCDIKDFDGHLMSEDINYFAP